jgi:serine/threonine protein kinase
LGNGSQAETLEALDKLQGRLVAIKRFLVSRATSWKDVELAEREAVVLASLEHPSLPRYIDRFEEDGALYLVMEKIEGESLAQRQRRGARFDQQQVIAFLSQVSETLDYLHGLAPPVVHRDIKPGNVILTPAGQFCLVDFGSVRDRVKPEGGSTVVGTFGFMAPEQFQGRAGAGSDVYAVGATALSLLTGQAPETLPHKGLTLDVRTALPNTSAELVNALERMLEPNPDQRAQSVKQALSASGLLDPKFSKRGTGQAATTEKSASPQDSTEGELDEFDLPAYPKRESRKERRARLRAEKQRRKADEERVHNERGRRRAEARAARDHSSRKRTVPPGIVLGRFLLIALRIAALATFLLFGVLLPLLFAVLSAIDPRLRLKVSRMLEIGRQGQAGLALAGEHIRFQFLGGPAPTASSRVASESNQAMPRRRVVIETEAHESHHADETESEVVETEADQQPRNRHER